MARLTKKDLLWRNEIPKVRGASGRTPIILEDRVIVSQGWDRPASDDAGYFLSRLQCLRPESGEVMWELVHDFVTAAALAPDGNIWWYDWDGLLRIVSPDGEELTPHGGVQTNVAGWSFGADFACASPTVNEGSVVCLDLSGATRWERELPDGSSTQALAVGDVVLVGVRQIEDDDDDEWAPPTYTTALIAFAAADGTERWRATVPGYANHLVTLGDRIVLSGGDGLHEIEVSDGSTTTLISDEIGLPTLLTDDTVIARNTDTAPWSMRVLELRFGEVTRRWERETDHVADVAAVNGQPLVLWDSGHLALLNPHTGEEQWRMRANASSKGNGGVAVSDDLVVIAQGRGVSAYRRS